MKGIGLFLVLVIVLVIAAMALTSFTLTSGTVLKDACRDTVTNKVTGWTQKMAFSTATSVEDDILLPKDCVEFVEHDGIKFRGEDKKYVFRKTNCRLDSEKDSRTVCTPDQLILFAFDGQRKLPSDNSYRVQLEPPQTIRILGEITS